MSLFDHTGASAVSPGWRRARKMARCLLGPTAACLVLLAAWPLAAQTLRPQVPLAGESPTRGVELPAASLVSAADPSGLELNPGAIGLLESWNLMLHHTEVRDRGRLAGGGDALLFATPVPLIRSLVFGAGLQWLRPEDPIGYANSAKLSLGLAWRPGPAFALGLGFHTFFSNADPALDDISTLDIGLVVRPFEWLAAGLVVRDVTTPLFDEYPIQRVYDLEIATRPLGTRRLEIAAGVRIGERRAEVDPRLRIEGEPLRGLRLFGSVEMLRRDFYRTGAELTDVRGTVGLGVDLERAGIAFATHFGRHLPAGPGPLADDATRAAYQGVSGTVHLRGSRRDPLVTFRKRIIDLDLSDSLSSREMVRIASLMHQVERRDDIAGVLLRVRRASPGWAQAQEIRRWLKRLRRAGKTSYAYLEQPSAREYYLAAAADKLLLDPAGSLGLIGLGTQALFFRGLFDRIGVSPQFVRIAEYKSAPESYTRRSGSSQARENREGLLSDLFDQLVGDIAADRRGRAKDVRGIVDEGPFIPPEALRLGLVDAIVEPGELKRHVEDEARGRLMRPDEMRRVPERWPVGPVVAVLVVEGDIVSGESMDIPLLDRKLVGDVTIDKALTWARTSEEVKAVVIRIESPGGSALASDHMWRAAMQVRKAKPVVVSLGNVAASGGYYLASAGDRVFAEPAAVTGSIGIFSGKFDVSGLLALLGIGVDTHSRGKRALLESFTRPYTAEERKLVLERLQYYYRSFLGAVAKGRKMTMDDVHRSGEGRVWTGRQALSRKLIDAHGGMIDAIEEAKRRAGIPLDRPVRIALLPEERPNFLLRLVSMLSRSEARSAAALPVPTTVLETLRAIPPVLLRARSGEPLARMPHHISFGPE